MTPSPTRDLPSAEVWRHVAAWLREDFIAIPEDALYRAALAVIADELCRTMRRRASRVLSPAQGRRAAAEEASRRYEIARLKAGR